MRSKSEFKSHTNIQSNEHCDVIFTNIQNKNHSNSKYRNNNNDNIDEKTMDKIMDKINIHPHIPKCLFQSDLYNLCGL